MNGGDSRNQSPAKIPSSKPDYSSLRDDPANELLALSNPVDTVQSMPLSLYSDTELHNGIDYDSDPPSEIEDTPLIEGENIIKESQGWNKVKDTSDPRKEKDEHLCGLGSWRPSCLQPMASVYTFVTLVGLSYFMSGMAIKSLFAQIVSIERQFNIDSSQSGLFGSAFHLGYACTVLFVGHLARVTHIPLAIGVAGVVNGLLVMAPSFLELYAPYSLAQFELTNDTVPSIRGHANLNHHYVCTTFQPNSSFLETNLTLDLNNFSHLIENWTHTIKQTSLYPNSSHIIEHSSMYPNNSLSNHTNASTIPTTLAAGNLTKGNNKALMVGNPEMAAYAYHLLLFSLLLQGAINSFRHGCLPHVYVDDNVLDKTKTGTYLVVFFVFAELTGPVGDVINGFLSNIPVDLSDTNMSRKDPRFVSAWWLGFLLFGFLSILSALPIIFLPRHLVPVERQREALEDAIVSFGGVGHSQHTLRGGNISRKSMAETKNGTVEAEDEDGLEQNNRGISHLMQLQPDSNSKVYNGGYERVPSDVSDNGKTDNHTCHSNSTTNKEQYNLTFLEIIKDFPRSVVRIFKSPLYALLVLEMTIIFIPLSGMVWPFRVKYTMFEYNVSMAMTNTAKGLSSALTHIVGTLIGSLLSRRISTNMGYLRLILLTAILAWMVTPLMLVFGCGNKHVVGLLTDNEIVGDYNTTDSTSCSCDPDVNLLSCGSDGQTYLSPCYAGCTAHSENVFTNCSEIPSDTQHPAGTVIPGICNIDCFQNFVIFNILAATQVFIFSINNMPRHLLALRILQPKDRAFGSAVLHFCPFIASLPAPYIFGKWIESMCLVWSSDHCSLYDRVSMRYLMIGTEVLVAGLTVLTYFIMVIICKRLDQKAEDTSAQQQEIVIPRPSQNEQRRHSINDPLILSDTLDSDDEDL